MTKFFKFLRRRWIVAFVIVLILLGAVYFLFFRKSGNTTYEAGVVKRGVVVQEVSVTGTVKPATSVDLGFQVGGKVSFINTDVGKRVGAGQVLVTLSNLDLKAQLAQAQAKLDELKKGTRPEEIIIQEGKIQDAKDNLLDVISDSYTKSDDAIRNKTDKLFSNPSTFPQLNIYVNDLNLKSQIESDRFSIESILNRWKNNLSSAAEAKIGINSVKNFLDKLASAVNILSPTSSLSQTIIDGYKADISTARTNINTAITNLSAAESTLSQEENQLALDKAGTVSEQIRAQEAAVEEVQAYLAKTIIYSPINGIVTKQEAKVGEIISANTTVVSVISDVKYQIEAYVPEADIAKIKINDPAKVTLDAYGSDINFEAKVVAIDPAETVIEGVSTYKTTLQFTKEDERVKSGMTANTDILTAKKENTLYVPQRAVLTKDGEKIVRVINGTQINEVPVQIGLKGSDGNIEILNGLNENDKIVVYMK